MAIVLALLAAMAYGVGDFAGGVASRLRSAVTVLLYSYPVGALLMVALLPLFPGTLSTRVLVFGVLGGISGMLGVVLLYRLMAIAPMNVVSPVTAVLAAAVPVGFGVLTGDRPSVLAWLGVLVGVLAVLLVTRTPAAHPHRRVGPVTIGLAVLSGVGFGAYFILLARAGSDSGLWPVVVSRLTSAVLIVPLAFGVRDAELVRGRLLGLCAVAGVLDALANLLFLLASRHGFLSLVSVITALYPATTVLLAATVLHERTGWLQRGGLVLAGTAIVLITV